VYHAVIFPTECDTAEYTEKVEHRVEIFSSAWPEPINWMELALAPWMVLALGLDLSCCGSEWKRPRVNTDSAAVNLFVN
jgi:hypothetical protein